MVQVRGLRSAVVDQDSENNRISTVFSNVRIKIIDGGLTSRKDDSWLGHRCARSFPTRSTMAPIATCTLSSSFSCTLVPIHSPPIPNSVLSLFPSIPSLPKYATIQNHLWRNSCGSNPISKEGHLSSGSVLLIPSPQR